jgi:hypothetical protein
MALQSLIAAAPSDLLLVSNGPRHACGGGGGRTETLLATLVGGSQRRLARWVRCPPAPRGPLPRAFGSLVAMHSSSMPPAPAPAPPPTPRYPSPCVGGGQLVLARIGDVVRVSLEERRAFLASGGLKLVQVGARMRVCGGGGEGGGDDNG